MVTKSDFCGRSLPVSCYLLYIQSKCITRNMVKLVFICLQVHINVHSIFKLLYVVILIFLQVVWLVVFPHGMVAIGSNEASFCGDFRCNNIRKISVIIIISLYRPGMSTPAPGNHKCPIISPQFVLVCIQFSWLDLPFYLEPSSTT